MPDSVFIDSNIWLYAFVKSQDQTKHELASELISDNILVGTQVLNELAVNLIRKAGTEERLIGELIKDFYQKYCVVSLYENTLLRASTIREAHSVSFWDSVIIGASLENNCQVLYSEDLQHGQIIDGKLKIVNPFTQ